VRKGRRAGRAVSSDRTNVRFDRDPTRRKHIVIVAITALVQDESSRFYISRVDIYRLNERRDQEAILDPDDYEATAQIVGFMDRTTMEGQAKTIGHLQFTDAVNLTDAQQLGNTRLRYSVRYVNRRGQAATFQTPSR